MNRPERRDSTSRTPPSLRTKNTPSIVTRVFQGRLLRLLRRPPSNPHAHLEKGLGQARNYLLEIENYHQKLAANGLLFEVAQDGVPFATMSMERHRFAKVLAREVSSGRYQFQPARRKTVNVDGKLRDLYLFCPSDRIVHGVVARLLTEEVAPHLPQGVHSYQRGRGWWDGVEALSRFLRNYVRRTPLRQRGIYVLRRDIRQYSDSIPIDDRAPVWNLLREILSRNRLHSNDCEQSMKLLCELIRPDIVSDEAGVSRNIRGIPTGSPITSALYNLCALPLDHALGQVAGGVYARYSDDFVFAHPDAEVAKEASQQIRDVLTALGLRANEEKGQTLYLTGAGRASEEWSSTRSSTAFSFLGCRLSLNGEIFLKRKRSRKVLRDLRRRALRTAEVLPHAPLDKKGRLVCSALNEALNASSLFQQKSSRVLRMVVTDRTQLKHFDKLIELIVAETVSGVRGPRAFRIVPPHTIRGVWGLISLFHERNLTS